MTEISVVLDSAYSTIGNIIFSEVSDNKQDKALEMSKQIQHLAEELEKFIEE